MKQKIIDLKITPLNDLQLDLKQLNSNQYEFNLYALLNFNNESLDNHNKSHSVTKVLLDVHLKFNDYTELPLNYYAKVDYNVNITLLKPIDTKLVKILIDDKNLSIKFLFNNTVKVSEKSFKFLFQLFSNNCMQTLLASKEFEIRFSDQPKQFSNKPTAFKNDPTKGSIILAPSITTTTTILSTTKIMQQTLVFMNSTTTSNFSGYKVINSATDDELDDLKISNINLSTLIRKSKQKLFNYSIFKLILYGLIVLFTIILVIFFVNMIIIYYKSKKFKKKYEAGHETASNWQFEFKTNGKSHLLPSKHSAYLNQHRQQSFVSENYYGRNMSYLHPVVFQTKNFVNSSDTEFDITSTTVSSVKQNFKSKKSKDFSVYRKNFFFTKKSLSKSASSFKQVKDWVWLGKDGIEFINENQMNNLSNNNCSLINSSLLPKTMKKNGYLNRWSTPNNHLVANSNSDTSSSTHVNSIVLTDTNTNKSESITNNNAEMNVTTYSESPMDYGVYEDMANYFDNLKESRA